MSAKFEVIWANIAENDLINILEYIAEENLTNAIKIFNRIKKSASKLHHLPERGRIVPELMDQGVNLYRELIVPPYRIIYRISEKKMLVLLVIDSRQNAEDILLKRLIKL